MKLTYRYILPDGCNDNTQSVPLKTFSRRRSSPQALRCARFSLISVKKDKLWVLPPPPPVTLMYVLFRKVFRGLSSVKSRGISRYLVIVSLSRLAQLKMAYRSCF